MSTPLGRVRRLVTTAAAVATAGIALPGTALAAAAAEPSPDAASVGHSASATPGAVTHVPTVARANEPHRFEPPSPPTAFTAAEPRHVDDGASALGRDDRSFGYNGNPGDDDDYDSGDYDPDTGYHGDIAPGRYLGSDEQRHREESERYGGYFVSDILGY